MPFTLNRRLLHLHFIVFIWGFTGILGKLIDLSVLHLVWYRLILTLAAFCLLAWYKNEKAVFKPKRKHFLMGAIVLAHWLSFYGAIQLSNVSVTLCAFSSTSLFTALLEPYVFKQKHRPAEFVFSLIVIAGIAYIFKAETQYVSGILLGIVAAATGSMFTTFNGLWAKEGGSSMALSFGELLGAFVFNTVLILFVPEMTFPVFDISAANFGWLLLLALGCTVYPFVASIGLMKHLNPFTMSLAVNLEPIYSIIVALLIFGKSEYMSGDFYVGAAIIFAAVIAYPVWKKRYQGYSS